MTAQDQPTASRASGDTGATPPPPPPIGAEAEAAAGSEAGAAPPKSGWLPVVMPMSARIDSDDAAIIDEWPAPGRTLPPRATSRSGWTARLTGRAAVIATAAVLGGLVGAAATTGMGHVLAARDGEPDAVDALRTSIGQLAGEIKALKDGVGGGSRATADGLASLEDRLAGAERAQADLTAQIASLTSGLSHEAVADVSPVSPEITGSITRANLPVASDWVLWRVRNGRALVQGNGGYFEVVPGSQLPGLGLVQRIVKEDGRWVVMTRTAVIAARG